MGKKPLEKLVQTVAGLGEVLLQDINADTPLRDSTQGLYQVPLCKGRMD